MSRLPTIYEGENDLYQNKLNMLQSNITRVQNQNRKLQALLEHTDQFDKLRDSTLTTQAHWNRLAALADRVNAMNGLLKTTRDHYHSTLTQLNHHITKHIISDLSAIKTKNKEHENRLNEMAHRWRSRIRKDVAPLKDKLQREIALRKQQYLAEVEACEGSFKKEFEERIIPRIAVNLEDIFDDRYRNCRTELGHVQNLLDYYANRDKPAKFQFPEQKREAVEIEAAILQQSAIRDEYNQMQKAISAVISNSCNRINAETETIELRLKRVGSQINWIKNQQKGKKRSNKTETSFSSDVNAQNLHLVELQEQIDNLNCQALGLGKHFDRFLVERKLLRSSFSNWSHLQEQQKQFLLRNGHKMLAVRQRISKLSSKLTQYSQFYKLANP